MHEQIEKILSGQLIVINIGLRGFAESFEEQEVEVVQVDWTPPAGGDQEMIDLLERICCRVGWVSRIGGQHLLQMAGGCFAVHHFSARSYRLPCVQVERAIEAGLIPIGVDTYNWRVTARRPDRCGCGL